MKVPWSGFDLINQFNGWKKTADAGRVFAVDANSDAEQVDAGLRWRAEVCQQVFEEAAVDLGKALAAFIRVEERRPQRPQGRFPANET